MKWLLRIKFSNIKPKILALGTFIIEFIGSAGRGMISGTIEWPRDKAQGEMSKSNLETTIRRRYNT